MNIQNGEEGGGGIFNLQRVVFKEPTGLSQQLQQHQQQKMTSRFDADTYNNVWGND
jgi:hypothetical protein